MNELQAMEAVAAQLRTLTFENGYHSDAGTRVYVFRDGFSAPDETPWIGVLFDGRDPLDAASRFIGCPTIRVKAQLLIVGAVELDPSGGPAEPLTLIDDIDRCLFGPAATAAFAPLQLTLSPGSALALPFEEGDAHTEIQNSVTAEFTKSLAP